MSNILSNYIRVGLLARNRTNNAADTDAKGIGIDAAPIGKLAFYFSRRRQSTRDVTRSRPFCLCADSISSTNRIMIRPRDPATTAAAAATLN